MSDNGQNKATSRWLIVGHGSVGSASAGRPSSHFRKKRAKASAACSIAASDERLKQVVVKANTLARIGVG